MSRKHPVYELKLRSIRPDTCDSICTDFTITGFGPDYKATNPLVFSPGAPVSPSRLQETVPSLYSHGMLEKLCAMIVTNWFGNWFHPSGQKINVQLVCSIGFGTWFGGFRGRAQLVSSISFHTHPLIFLLILEFLLEFPALVTFDCSEIFSPNFFSSTYTSF